MREIKFRAWDEEKRKMIYQKPVLAFYYFMTWDGGHVFENGLLMPYIMLQYTGLKDKTGKEAYHKDRVRFLTIYSETGASDEWTGIVEWDDEDLCWYIDNDSDKWPVVKFRFIDYFEIIGNVFENSEKVEP